MKFLNKTTLSSCTRVGFLASMSSLVIIGSASAAPIQTEHHVAPDGLFEFQTIQAAIDAASDGDQVVLHDGVYTADDPLFVADLKGKVISLRAADPGSRNVVIDGEGRRFGLGCVRGEGGNTVISGITFRNCDFHDFGFGVDVDRDGHIDWTGYYQGSAILNWSSHPTIRDCRFEGNSSGIYNWSSNPMVEDCVFENNMTGVRSHKDANEQDPAPSHYDRCEFRGNEIGFHNKLNTVVNQSTFEDNGRGIRSYEGRLVVSDCDFTKNGHGEIYGGAIRSSNIVEITATSFTRNTGDFGGAIRIEEDGRESLVTDCTFMENFANQGGAINNWGGLVNVQSCQFIGNEAIVAGGAIINTYASHRLENCRFEANRAPKGGAVFTDEIHGGAPVDSMTVDPTQGHIVDCEFLGNTAGFGGALHASDTKTAISGCSFDNNFATNSGGALALRTWATTVENTTFDSNISFNEGGAISQDWSGLITLYGCHFTSNSALNGGGIHLRERSHAQLDSCSFENQVAFNDGGALLLETESSAQMFFCDFSNLEALNAGGAIKSASATIEMTGCTLEENEAALGGALMLHQSELVLTTCWMNSNTSEGPGGAIEADGSQLFCTGGNFMNNRSGASGGAIDLDNSLLEMTNSYFASNAAVAYGGAIESKNAAVPVITESTFIGGGLENATYGGAIDIDHSSGPVTLHKLMVSGCMASVRGGGLYSDGVDTLVDGGTIKGNHATKWGAVGSIQGTVRIRNSSICGNTLEQVSSNYDDLGGNHITDTCCRADLDGDGIVDGADLTALLGEWGACGEEGCRADLDHDGLVDGADMTQLLGDWGNCG